MSHALFHLISLFRCFSRHDISIKKKKDNTKADNEDYTKDQNRPGVLASPIASFGDVDKRGGSICNWKRSHFLGSVSVISSLTVVLYNCETYCDFLVEVLVSTCSVEAK